MMMHIHMNNKKGKRKLAIQLDKLQSLLKDNLQMLSSKQHKPSRIKDRRVKLVIFQDLMKRSQQIGNKHLETVKLLLPIITMILGTRPNLISLDQIIMQLTHLKDLEQVPNLQLKHQLQAKYLTFLAIVPPQNLLEISWI